MMPERKLYDLAGADPAFRFSPYCWRTKLALAHKGVAVETIPWRFTDKHVIAFSGQGLVPVLVDGDETIHDSYAIAEYLETAYPNGPFLFGDVAARALTNFIGHWADAVLGPALVRIVAPDVFKLLAPKDLAYFRETREARFGMTIEALAEQRGKHMPVFKAALAPLRHTLSAQPFIAGEGPAYADHIVFGTLQWGCLTSSTPLLQDDDVIKLWMEKLLETYGIS